MFLTPAAGEFAGRDEGHLERSRDGAFVPA